MSKPANAPACFAAASVFTHDSNVCRGCCAFKECSDASFETLKSIRHIVNVEDIMKRHAKAKKLARDTILAQDELAAAGLPPGNSQPSLPQAVERKTQVANVKFSMSADEEQIITTLSVKSQRIALALCNTGAMQRVKKGVQEGRVALTETAPAFIRVALTSLISGGFSKSDLKNAYMDDLKWGEATAASHVSMICPVLLKFGIAQEEEGRLVPAPVTA